MWKLSNGEIWYSVECLFGYNRPKVTYLKVYIKDGGPNSLLLSIRNILVSLVSLQFVRTFVISYKELNTNFFVHIMYLHLRRKLTSKDTLNLLIFNSI